MDTGAAGVRVRLLGPVEVTVDDVPRPVAGVRRKAVLAALALRAGEVVSTDWAVEVVWGGDPPATAANTLQSHVSYLRGALGSRTAILARPPGYVLDLGGRATDVQEAERLIEEGGRAQDPAEGVARLRAAVGLWRGQPLADLGGLGWFEEQAYRLETLLVGAREALVELRLALGQHAQLVPELEELVRAYPVREQMSRQLMLALYRTGRQADALAVYQRLRRTLGEELGIDPSQPLRELETAILRQEAALDVAAPARVPVLVGPFAAANRDAGSRPGRPAAGPTGFADGAEHDTADGAQHDTPADRPDESAGGSGVPAQRSGAQRSGAQTFGAQTFGAQRFGAPAGGSGEPLPRRRRWRRRHAVLAALVTAAGAAASVTVNRFFTPSPKDVTAMGPRSARWDGSGSEWAPPVLEAAAGAWHDMMASSQLAEGDVREIESGSLCGFVRRENGRLQAVSGICTHQGCRLSLDAADRRLNCPCHRTSFALGGRLVRSQLAVPPPALPRLPVRERGGRIEVYLPIGR